jgi:hypothetical protein
MNSHRRDQQGANLSFCPVSLVKFFGCNLGSDKYKLLKIYIVNLILVGLTELGKLRGLVELSN